MTMTGGTGGTGSTGADADAYNHPASCRHRGDPAWPISVSRQSISTLGSLPRHLTSRLCLPVARLQDRLTFTLPADSDLTH